MNSLEVRIPISPRADYFTRVRLIALSIREFYRDAIFQVSVGSDTPAYDLTKAYPWSAELGIEWVWVAPADYHAWRDTAHPYIATMMQRFKPPFAREHLLMLDADVLAIRRFDELFANVNAVCGVMAHVSPFSGEHHEQWASLFSGYQLAAPPFEYEHSGWGIMETNERLRFAPPYFNTGVLFAPAALLSALYAPYMDAIGFVRGKIDSYFVEQIALSLALLKTGITAKILPHRYNFPNQAGFDAQLSAELADLRLLHFLRTDTIDRERDFIDGAALRALSGRSDLRGSNEVLRRRVAELVARAGLL